jgi:hypothetical protein
LRALWTAVASGWILTACGGGEYAGACGEQYGTYKVRYQGSVQGTGRITLEASATDAGAARVKPELLAADANARPALVLSGVGTCESGLAQVRFDGGAGENDQVKILGGTLVGVFPTRVLSEPFGKWEMLILDKARSEQQTVSGYWGQAE